LKNIKKLIDNKITLEDKTYFASIIGSSPSKGARSPLLWNHSFKLNGYNYKMLPFDVKKKNLKKLLKELNLNKYYLGGAVTIPHKEEVAKLLKSKLTNEAKKIGAVNCLFKGKNNKINGTNTDGEAALKVFVEKFGKLKNKKILLLGPGGAGKAVATYFSKELNKKSNLFIAGRSKNAKKFSIKIKSIWINWNQLKEKIDMFDLIINCTNIGFGNLSNSSPLSKKLIDKINNQAIIYDIIYLPSPTKLLKIASSKKLKILDGKLMNLEQAVIAFNYCLKKNKRKVNTRKAMFEIYKSLV